MPRTETLPTPTTLRATIIPNQDGTFGAVIHRQGKPSKINPNHQTEYQQCETRAEAEAYVASVVGAFSEIYMIEPASVEYAITYTFKDM